MLEIMLEDGEKYGMRELQCRFREYVEGLLRPLSEGHAPDGLPPDAMGAFYFSEVIESMEDLRRQLDINESHLFKSIIKLKEKAFSFDRARYSSLGKEERARYAQRFGLEFAHALKDVMRGYKDPPNCVPTPDPVSQYVTWTKTPEVTDTKTRIKIKYPFGLMETD